MAEVPFFFPANAPEPVKPEITIDRVQADRQVVASRGPNARVTRHSQLTMREKSKLLDTFLDMEDVADPPIVSTVTDWDRLLNSLFEDWNARQNAPKNPILPDRKLEHTHLKVGHLRENLPLTDAQKAANAVQKAERSADAPAYFGLTLDYGTGAVLWTWRDSKNARLSPKYVELNQGMTDVTIRIEAIQDYDSKERTRIRNYNKQLVLACARRSIKKWAKQGTARPPRVDLEDHPQDIQKMVFAAPFVKAESLRLAQASDVCLEDFLGAGSFWG
ncbi:hypothetical protein ACHAPJ_005348 [Fusarium lateritium]